MRNKPEGPKEEALMATMQALEADINTRLNGASDGKQPWSWGLVMFDGSEVALAANIDHPGTLGAMFFDAGRRLIGLTDADMEQAKQAAKEALN